jgi:hypothetical protein
LRRGAVTDVVEACLAVTADYADRVAALEAVSEANRRRLVDAVTSVRRSVKRTCSGLAPG